MSTATFNKTRQAAFLLKGSLCTLTILHLNTYDAKSFAIEMVKTVAKTPNFFKHLPIVIDLDHIKQQDKTIDFKAISNDLREHGIIPVGVRNGSEQQHKAAVNAGFAVLSETHAKKVVAAAEEENKPQPAKIITQPVRSGQQVYAKNADLVVLNKISLDAELIADGSIYVYGSLSGRALAGVKGDKTAKIFCQRLDAQLVSIAGIYRLYDDIKSRIRRHPCQVYLDNEQLVVERFP